MASQFDLFRHKRFTPMFFTQFLGAFNDNFFKQALLLLLTYSGAAALNMEIATLNNLAAMLFILPYFLFSALAGQLADKYEKSRLTRYIKILEIIIMVLAGIGLIFEWYWFLFLALFLLGTQSTFFGPIKYAYLPQAMHDDELVGANGLFQTGTSLSILLGMIVAGFVAGLDNYVYWAATLVLVFAALGYLASRMVPLTPAAQPTLNVDWNIFRTSFATIQYLRTLPLLFFIIMGNSWFWFYGATFLNQTPEFSKTILNGDESVVIFLLTLFSVGVAAGSLLCKTLTKNQVSFHLLPYGMAGLSIFAIGLYAALSRLNILIDDSALLGIMDLISMRDAWWVFGCLFCLGFSGGIYIVPLYAAMQAYSPISHRSRVIGANNIFNAIFMVTSAIFAILVLTQLNLTLPQLFLITGIINLFFGVFLYRKLKTHQQQTNLTLSDTL